MDEPRAPAAFARSATEPSVLDAMDPEQSRVVRGMIRRRSRHLGAVANGFSSVGEVINAEHASPGADDAALQAPSDDSDDDYDDVDEESMARLRQSRARTQSVAVPDRHALHPARQQQQQQQVDLLEEMSRMQAQLEMSGRLGQELLDREEAARNELEAAKDRIWRLEEENHMLQLQHQEVYDEVVQLRGENLRVESQASETLQSLPEKLLAEVSHRESEAGKAERRELRNHVAALQLEKTELQERERELRMELEATKRLTKELSVRFFQRTSSWRSNKAGSRGRIGSNAKDTEDAGSTISDEAEVQVHRPTLGIAERREAVQREAQRHIDFEDPRYADLENENEALKTQLQTMEAVVTELRGEMAFLRQMAHRHRRGNSSDYNSAAGGAAANRRRRVSLADELREGPKPDAQGKPPSVEEERAHVSRDSVDSDVFPNLVGREDTGDTGSDPGMEDAQREAWARIRKLEYQNKLLKAIAKSPVTGAVVAERQAGRPPRKKGLSSNLGMRQGVPASKHASLGRSPSPLATAAQQPGRPTEISVDRSLMTAEPQLWLDNPVSDAGSETKDAVASPPPARSKRQSFESDVDRDPDEPKLKRGDSCRCCAGLAAVFFGDGGGGGGKHRPAAEVPQTSSPSFSGSVQSEQRSSLSAPLLR